MAWFFLATKSLGGVEEMLVHAVVQDAAGLADIVELVVARIDEAVDQVGGFRHGGYVTGGCG